MKYKNPRMAPVCMTKATITHFKMSDLNSERSLLVARLTS
jgi:hypothetical protein